MPDWFNKLVAAVVLFAILSIFLALTFGAVLWIIFNLWPTQ